MTTPLVLLGLAVLAGAVVWALSVRQTSQRGSSSWEPDPKPAASETTASPARAVATPSAMSAATEMPAATEAPALVSEEGDLDDGTYPATGDSFAYLPLGVSDGLNARTRLIGLAGLIALIVLTSAAVALVVWLLGHALGQQLSHFANG